MGLASGALTAVRKMAISRLGLTVVTLLCVTPWVVVRADCWSVLEFECGAQCHPGDASCAFDCT
eukprot:COSAG02_NODE_751_length_17653_cov_172.765011_7_plen_64_part_00